MTITPSAGTSVPVALHIALVLVLVEVVAEIAYVLRSSVYGPGGIALLILVLATKVFLAEQTRRLNAAAAMGLLFFESVGLLVAVFADWAVWLRLSLAGSVVGVIVCVASSFHAFPTPELPQ